MLHYTTLLLSYITLYCINELKSRYKFKLIKNKLVFLNESPLVFYPAKSHMTSDLSVESLIADPQNRWPITWKKSSTSWSPGIITSTSGKPAIKALVMKF